jgi:hypothetical protein
MNYVRTALVVHMGKSELKKIKCLACQKHYKKNDRVIVVETWDDDCGGIAVSYHEHCAPASVIDNLARAVNDNRLSKIDKKID